MFYPANFLFLQMACSISISVSKSTNLAGGRLSPKAPKVRTFLKIELMYCQFCFVPLRTWSKKMMQENLL